MRWLLILICTFLFALVNAQEREQWQVKNTSDFTYYFKGDQSRFLNLVDSFFHLELRHLQKNINYYASHTIDVFIVENQEEEKTLRITPLPEPKNKGGDIPLYKNKVVVLKGDGYSQLRDKFRKAVSNILVNELMFGGTFQDNIKNANLIQLPDWVLPGLELYLTNGWSPELDNSMRVMHSEHGIKNFNTTPNRYNVIKGASFWHYMVSTYGNNTISTLLYMVRLSRKFNSAIFYAYQVSLSDLFIGWKTFYEEAYLFDDKKPNPINGNEISDQRLLDVLILSEQIYYTLERNVLGIAVYKYKEGHREKIKQLASDEFILGKFKGSLQLPQEPKLLINTSKGLKVINLSSNDWQLFPEIKYASYATSEGNTLFVCSSSLLGSRFYRISIGKQSLLFKANNRINSFSVKGNQLGAISNNVDSSSIVLYNVVSRDISERMKLPFNSRQVIFASDSVLLFNANKNGIWNGCYWNISSSKVEFVTDYGSNILHHQYDNNVFVEFLDRDQSSTLYIAPSLQVEDFYFYDTLVPSYFNNLKKKETASKPDAVLSYLDSLQSYSFQNPINPHFDFTASNYDSLYKVNAQNQQQGKAPEKAPSLFKPSKLIVQVSNQVEEIEGSSFSDGFESLTPNNINLKINSKFTNQFNNQSFSMQYIGFVQPMAHKIALGYTREATNWQYSARLFHRQRALIKEEFRNRYNLSQVSIGAKLKNDVVSPFVNFKFSNEIKNALAINAEGLQLDPELFNTTKAEVGVRIVPKFNKAGLDVTLAANTYYSTIGTGSEICGKLIYQNPVSSWFGITTILQAATSFGQNPNYYSLGGYATDLLNNNAASSFSDFKNPSFYQLVYGIRGFESNHRNGTSYYYVNQEISLKPFHLLIKRPLVSELFNNLELIPFADLGTAFYGSSSHHPGNTFGSKQITSSTGTIEINVRSYQNPILAALGGGLGSKLYGYRLRVDYALGFEEFQYMQSRWHLHLGKSF